MGCGSSTPMAIGTATLDEYLIRAVVKAKALRPEAGPITDLPALCASYAAGFATVESLFNDFDTDKDGQIDFNEFKAGAASKAWMPARSSDEELDKIFDITSVNASQKTALRKNDFLMATVVMYMRTKDAASGLPEEVVALADGLEALFVRLDSSGNGHIEIEELVAACGGDTATGSKIFIALDANKDGRVSLREFITGVEELAKA